MHMLTHNPLMTMVENTVTSISEKQQLYILEELPSDIRFKRDVYKLKTKQREPHREAWKIYDNIKKNFLFNLDKSIENLHLDYNKIFNNIMEISDSKKKYLENEIDNEIDKLESFHKTILHYDEFTWIKDPYLLSIILFHEKLNMFRLECTKTFIKFKYNSKEIEKAIKEVIKNKDYIKSIIVISLQPVLTYGAILASIKNDYSYIMKYENEVSKAAEYLFSKNPSIRRFFLKGRG